MKAIVVHEFGGADKLKYQEIEKPTPGPSQVLIKTLRSSVNFADIMATNGTYTVTQLPFVPGIDSFGEIVGVGSEMESALIGTRVIAFCDQGGYSEFTLATKGLFFPVSKEFDDDQAGASPLLLGTCYGLLTQAATVSTGARILIHAGAGGIGTTAIQMAKALGASEIVGLVSSADKACVVEDLGALAIVTDTTSNYATRAKDAAGGAFDIILNSVAGSTIGQDLEVLAPFGTLVVFGIASGSAGVAYSNQLHPTSRTVAGYSFGNLRKNRPEQVAPLMEAALDLAKDGAIKFVVQGTMPLSDAKQAHEMINSRKTIGKILLEP